jgi:5-methylcytosine-specific restriction endonuclease McrA
MRIGELVRDHIGKIFRHCETDPAELMRLMDADYSRLTFGLAWPFCADANKVAAKDHSRYWTDHYVIGDRRVRVCSQWYERQRDDLYDYLRAKRIAVLFPPKPNREARSRPVPGNRNSRYGSIQIGDAQNAFIRVILSRVGEESFDERDWQETKAYFGYGCAYCDKSGADQMDHGVPINRAKLGEHRLGNLIPACKPCNVAKRQRDHREFLDDDLKRIDRIETYMESRGYAALGDNKQVKAVFEQAHKEVAALAEKYIAMLNDVLADKARPPSNPVQMGAIGDHPATDVSPTGIR